MNQKILLFISCLFLCWSSAFGLSSGDIAFVQYNADNTDNFAFVALVDIPANEEIKFTDNGWKSDNTWRTGEGVITWTAPASGVTAGTTVTITATTATSGTISGTLPAFSADGDQLIAYQGTSAMIAALNNEGSAIWQADATSTNTSVLPQGLTNGTNAVALTEVDNVKYTGATTGNKATLLAAINNSANWSGDNSTNQTFTGTFSVTTPSTPTITSSASLTNFSAIQGMASTSQSFTVSGDNLTGDLTVTAPTGYEISLDNTNFGGTQTLVVAGGNVTGEPKTVHIRITSGASVGTPSGNITITGGGATQVNVAVSGTVISSTSVLTSLVFNEVLANPNGTPNKFDTDGNGTAEATDEFIEIYNTSSSSLDISGLQFWDAGSKNYFTIPSSTTLGANEFVVVVMKVKAGGTLPTVSSGSHAFTANRGSGVLNNSGDNIVLYDPATNKYIQATYNGSTQGNPTSYTGFPAGATREGNVLNFGNATDGVSLALSSNGTIANPVNHNAIGNGSVLATPGKSNTAPTAITKIHTIQGDGTTSKIVGSTVTIEGIVVGDFQAITGNDKLKGFFVQEEDVDKDADLATSEGIFVYEGNASPVTDVSIGDKVQVTGKVAEYEGLTELKDITNITIVSNGNPLPTVASVSFNTAILNNDNKYISNLEQYEGMYVTFSQTLQVTELYNLDNYGEVTLIEGNRPTQFAQTNSPNVANYTQHLKDVAKRSVTLDDGTLKANPNPIKYPDGDLGTNDALRMGNTVTNLTGVLTFGGTKKTYQIHPTVTPTFVKANPRKATPDNVGGNLKVASLNVENYFKTLDDGSNTIANGWRANGANNASELTRQTQKLVTALSLMDADVYGLLELENDFRTVGTTGNALEKLVNELNTKVGAGTYDWVFPKVASIGTNHAIANGIIYKPAKVMPIGKPAILDNTVDANYTDTKNRPTLAVTFEEKATKEKFTLVMIHLKSKSSDCGAGDPNLNDGAGNCNQTRLKAVTALEAWLKTDPTGSRNSNFLIMGDFNAYAKEAPTTYLQGKGFTDIVNRFVGTNAYSYVFDGQMGMLDYAFTNANLLSKITGVTEWRINADEADALDYNTDNSRNTAIFDGTTPYRSSDHDPIIVGLNLSGTANKGVTSSSSLTPSYSPAPALKPAPIAEKIEPILSTRTTYQIGRFIELPNDINGTQVFYTIMKGKGVIIGNQIYLQGAGEIQVTAETKGDNYLPTLYHFTLQVDKGNQTLTTLDVKNIPNTTQNAKGFQPNFGVKGVKFEIIEGQEFATVDLNGNIVPTGKGIGQIKLKVWKPESADFNVSETVEMTFNVEKANQTIIFNNISNRTFEPNETLSLSATASSGLNVSFEAMSDNIEIQGNTLKIIGAGIVKIKAIQAGNDLYHSASEEVRSFVVYKRNQSIVFAEIEDKVFGETPFSLTASASSNLPISFEIIRGKEFIKIENEVITILQAGSVTIRAVQNGDDNYSSAQGVIRTFTIYPALDLNDVTFNLETYRLSLNFSSRGNFGLSNQFVVQLSNENGDFAQHSNLSARFDFSTNTITASIPERIVSSGKYQVRIIASSPRTLSNLLPVQVELYPKPRKLSIEPSIEPERTIICASRELNSYQWYLRNEAGEWEAIEGATERCLDLSTLSGRIETDVVVTVKGFIGNRPSDLASPYTYREPTAGVLATESEIVNKLRLYPNPTSEQFTLELTLKKAGDVRINLVDALGKESYAKSFDNMPLRFTKSFDLRPFAKGIYFLHIKTPSGTVVRKVIKK